MNLTETLNFLLSSTFEKSFHVIVWYIRNKAHVMPISMNNDNPYGECHLH